MRKSLFILSLLFSLASVAQELKCDVIVNAQQTGNENRQVFKTLENQLNEFINNTQWSNKSFTGKERINCSMVINITSNDNNLFQASIQVRSSRPVYNSSYSTPVYNFNDRDFSFRYQEFQNIVYNPSQFESNLVSVLAFHVYMILGMDADTFALRGGESHLQQARTILGYSQQGAFKGWKAEDGLQSRYTLIDNIMSPTYKEYRSVLYNYHIGGLDLMQQGAKRAKEKVAAAIMEFQKMNSRRPNSFILRVFFDAKASEIEDIFSDGPSVNIADMMAALTSIAPLHSSKWRNISF